MKASKILAGLVLIVAASVESAMGNGLDNSSNLTIDSEGITYLVQTVLHNETTNGDLSGNRLAPTTFNASIGSNEVIGSMNRDIDIEYFTLVVQPGQQLTALVAAELVAPDGRSFIGVQNGSQFSVTPVAAQPSDMYGYAHFGLSDGNIGTNILDDMGTAFGAQGFTGALQSGSYTFWLQNINDIASYRLDFQVAAVPEPGEYAMLLAGLAVVGAIARRRRITYS